MRDAERGAWAEGQLSAQERAVHTAGRQQKPSSNIHPVQGPTQDVAPVEWAQALPCLPPGCLPGEAFL